LLKICLYLVTASRFLVHVFPERKLKCSLRYPALAFKGVSKLTLWSSLWFLISKLYFQATKYSNKLDKTFCIVKIAQFFWLNKKKKNRMTDKTRSGLQFVRFYFVDIVVKFKIFLGELCLFGGVLMLLFFHVKFYFSSVFRPFFLLERIKQSNYTFTVIKLIKTR